jgi:excisionase family DNA binding protein
VSVSKVQQYLSPAEFAETLGLSVSTLKRWTDKGILKVERTAGGHRRISMNEALRFVRESGLRPVMPHRLGMGEAGIGDAGADPSRRVSELLLAGACEEARRFLVSAFAAGEDPATIGDRWLQPAFEQLGELWKHGEEGIAVEHRATEAVLRAVSEMRARVEPAETAPIAIGGAVSGDPYLLPTALVALVLAVNGFRSANLGATMPAVALLTVVERMRPRLVWMSVSTADAEGARRGAIEDATARIGKLGAVVAIGGRVAPERIPGAVVCRDLGALAALAKGLLA